MSVAALANQQKFSLHFRLSIRVDGETKKRKKRRIKKDPRRLLPPQLRISFSNSRFSLRPTFCTDGCSLSFRFWWGHGWISDRRSRVSDRASRTLPQLSHPHLSSRFYICTYYQINICARPGCKRFGAAYARGWARRCRVVAFASGDVVPGVEAQRRGKRFYRGAVEYAEKTVRPQ